MSVEKSGCSGVSYRPSVRSKPPTKAINVGRGSVPTVDEKLKKLVNNGLICSCFIVTARKRVRYGSFTKYWTALRSCARLLTDIRYQLLERYVDVVITFLTKSV